MTWQYKQRQFPCVFRSPIVLYHLLYTVNFSHIERRARAETEKPNANTKLCVLDSLSIVIQTIYMYVVVIRLMDDYMACRWINPFVFYFSTVLHTSDTHTKHFSYFYCISVNTLHWVFHSIERKSHSFYLHICKTGIVLGLGMWYRFDSGLHLFTFNRLLYAV